LASTGFLDRVGEDRVFMTLPTAVAAYQQWYKAGHGGEPPTIDP
jgi:SulP family sulfate permease